MNFKKVLGWVVVGVVGLLLFAAVAIPNLLRSRSASTEAMRVAQMKAFVAGEMVATDAKSAGRSGGADSSAYAERKVIHKVALELVVTNVGAAAADLRQITARCRGTLDHVQLQSASGRASGELQLRVPAEQLESALAEFKKVAVKVAHEDWRQGGDP